MQSTIQSRPTVRQRLFVACAAVAPAIFTASFASAEVKDWSSTAATSNWDTSGNWVNGNPANSGITDTARFNQASYLSHPSLTASRSIRNLVFGDGTTATATLNLDSATGAETLTIGNSSGAGVGSGGIDVMANAGAVNIAAPISLGITQTWTNNSANLLTLGAVSQGTRGLTIDGAGNTTIGGTLTGTGGLTKNGAGTLSFGASNTYTATTTVNAGILDVAGFSQTLGRVINEATITNSSDTLVTLTIGNRSQGSGTYTGKMDIIFDNGANNSSVFGGFQHAGNLTLKANSTGNINLTTTAVNNAGTITNSGSSTGASTLQIVGANVTKVIQNSASSPLILSGASSTWTSGLLIQNGTVNLGNNAEAAGAATNVLTIGDATVGANATLNTTASAGAGSQAIVVAAGAGTRTISNTTAPNPTFGGPVTLYHDLIVLNAATANGGTGLTFSGGISGTGNLLLQGNSATTTEGFYQGVRLTGGDAGNVVNNTGIITNAGTGAHDTIISAAIGSNVTGIIQDSATSRLVLAGINEHSTPLTVTLGTAQLAAGGAMVAGNLFVASGGVFETEGQTGGTEEEPDVTPASLLTFGIADTTTFDSIENHGVVTLGGDIGLDFASVLADGAQLDLFLGSGSYSSTVAQVLVSGAYSGALALDGGSLFRGTFGSQEISFDAATGDLSVVAAVPEPASLTLVALGLAGLAGRRRRQAV